MNNLLQALTRAARDLLRPAILWQALWPPLIATLIWVYVAVRIWAHSIAVISGWMPNFDAAWWLWITHWGAVFLLICAFGGLIYCTSLLLVALISLPFIIRHVAANDYPDLTRHGERPFIGSLANTASAATLFCFFWLICLPLCLIPGVLLILPLLLTAWLNQRTFRFDVLADFARRAEIRRLIADSRSRNYFAGVLTAAVVYVPVLHLFAPAFTALVFAHLGLTGLRELRQTQGVTLDDQK